MSSRRSESRGAWGRGCLQRYGYHTIAVALLVLLGLITFLATELSVSTDLGKYMGTAVDLLHGRGLVNAEHLPVYYRPGFPLLISASFAIGGVSVESAFWVIRLFAILGPVCLYLVGSALWNRTAGVIAALLALSSYSINYWSYRHLDHIWPVFVLLSFLFLYLALEREKLRWFVASGVALAAAYLVKEVAILFVPLPFLVVALTSGYRTRRRLLGAVVSVLPFAAVFILWGLYIHLQGGDLGWLLGQQGDVAVGELRQLGSDGVFAGILAMAGRFFAGLGSFLGHPAHDHSLFSNFVLAPFLLFSWGVILASAVRGDRRDKLVALTALCISPVLSRVGVNDMRLGQGLLFPLMTMAVTGRFVEMAVRWALERLSLISSRRRLLHVITLACVVGTLIGIQTFVGEERNAVFLEGSALVQFASGRPIEFAVTGGFADPAYRQAGEWIAQELPSGAKLVVSRPSEAKPVYFYSQGACPLYVMPILQTNKMSGLLPRTGSVVFLSSWAATVTPLNKFYALVESDLLGMLEDEGIEYVVVALQHNFLSLYLQANSGFSRVRSFGEGEVQIFEVIEPVPVEGISTLVTRSATKYLQRLQREDPEEYERLVEDFFGGILGWSADVIGRIVNGSYEPTVRRWTVY